MTQSGQAGATWYYAVGQDRAGPMNITMLRQMLASGQIPAQSLVWCEGMPNWIPAITHPDLAIAAQQQMQAHAQYARAPGAGQQLSYYGYVQGGETYYAGFWLRFAAWVIDFIVTMAVGCVLGLVIGVIAGVQAGMSGTAAPTFQGPGYEIGFYGMGALIGWLYYAIMESSSAQATLGKMACSIKVTNEFGERISFARATGRFFGRYLSAIILGIGFVMIAFTERKQALHDLMASTLVVRK
jgi:uncharacterized RDD family membrane protein YckC